MFVDLQNGINLQFFVVFDFHGFTIATCNKCMCYIYQYILGN